MVRFKLYRLLTSTLWAFFLLFSQEARAQSDSDALAVLTRQTAIQVGRAEALQGYSVPETQEVLQYELALNLLFDGNYVEASSLLFEAANALIAAAPQNAPYGEPTLEELNRFGVVAVPLKKLVSISPTNESTSKPLIAKLERSYPREALVFQKIEALEKSAERVRALEPAALQKYEETLDFLKNGELEQITIYVAPEGSDLDGSGECSKPFASLARAFKRIEAESSPTKRFCVKMKPGKYFVDQTARLKNARNVLICKEQEGSVELNGGRKITNFQRLSDRADVAKVASRFQDAARDKIFVADLSALGFKNLGRLGHRGYGPTLERTPTPALYSNGKLQTLARWPNEGEARLKFGEKTEPTRERADDGSKLSEGSTFRYDFDRPNDWNLSGDGSQDDVWAFGLYEWEWAANLRKVLAIDRDKKQITFDYPTGSGRYDYYFVNVLEELDAPGEYFVDRKSGLLYYYPLEGIETVEELNAQNVEFDEFEGVFVVLDSSENVVLQGLNLRCGRGVAITMNNCDACYFTEGRIEQIGVDAVTVCKGKYCGVLHSLLRELGGGGVAFYDAGDRKTLEPSFHILHDCYISGFDLIDRVYSPALKAYGCGVVATNNLICNSPHHGVQTDGNDMYFARNEIHSVVYEYSDQSGIDVYCDPSFRGIVIEKNLWRHIGSSFALCGQAGVRLDDSISGVVMLDNIFYRSSGGMFGGIQIHGGKDNLCRRNVFVDCKQAFSFSPWQNDRYDKFVKEKYSENVENPKYLETYPFFNEIFQHTNRNYVIDNDAINCGTFNARGDGLNVFVANRTRNEAPNLKELGVDEKDRNKAADDVFLTDWNSLKTWLERLSGISTQDVGLLKDRWNDANEPVAPQFTEAR